MRHKKEDNINKSWNGEQTLKVDHGKYKEKYLTELKKRISDGKNANKQAPDSQDVDKDKIEQMQEESEKNHKKNQK